MRKVYIYIYDFNWFMHCMHESDMYDSAGRLGLPPAESRMANSVLFKF